MSNVLIDANFMQGGVEIHLVVYQPMGMDVYHVMTNNYYQGQIVNTSKGWKAYTSFDMLSPMVVDRILEVVKEANK